MTQRRSLNVQALALVFGSGIAQLLVAVLFILTARGMRPDEYGPIVTVIGLGMAGAGFVDLGSNAYWIRELASGRITQPELSARASTRFLIALAITAIVVVASLFMAPAFAAAGVLLLTASTAQAVLVPLRADRRAEAVSWLTVLGRAISVAIFLVQLRVGVEPGLALWTSLALGDIALVLCALAKTPTHHRLKLRTRRLRNPWTGARWYAISTLSTTAAQLDLPIVAALAGPNAAGIYGAVNRWTQPVVVATGAFAQAAAPFMASTTRFMALRGQLLRASWILAVAVGACAAIFVLAPWLVSSLLGENFKDAAPVLRLLAVAMLLNTVTQPLTVALQSRRLDRLAATLVVITAATQLIATSILAPQFGALGAGVGVLAAQVVGLIATVSSVTAIARNRT